MNTTLTIAMTVKILFAPAGVFGLIYFIQRVKLGVLNPFSNSRRQLSSEEFIAFRAEWLQIRPWANVSYLLAICGLILFIVGILIRR
jgi:hypothetical protein